MKVRQRFVANSSSSSFCLIGARIKNTRLKDLDWEEIEELGIGIAGDNGEFVGLLLGYASDSSGVEEDDLDLDWLVDKVNKLPELLGTDKDNIKLFSGVMYG